MDCANSTPGTYTVTYTITGQAGCADLITSTPITISTAPSAAIAYPGSPFCDAGPAIVDHTGTAGGSFTSLPGLSIDSATGTIDLAASAPGNFTVIYALPAAGGCDAVNTTASITIHEHPNACLLYTSPSPRDRTRSRMPSSA